MRRRMISLGAFLFVGWLLGSVESADAQSPAGEQPAAHSDSDSPLTPEQALAAFRLEPGLRIELVAAEPLVVSPVALAFDARGRMFVAENRGYPTGPGDAGQIVMLEDTDGDGRCDRRTVFADGLTYPNGLLPWRDGLIVTCAPDVLFLQDTDGDDRADRRDTLFTGFTTTGSTQLRASHPLLGLDNWIYVTGGLTGGKISSPAHPEREPVTIRRADFRFRPDGTEFEMADGGGQFGMTFDDYGRRFICYNRVQIQHVVLPSRYLRRNPHLTFSATVQDCPVEMVAELLRNRGSAARLFPISSNITTADSHAGTFTAACGVTIYRGDALPDRYLGGAFSCDPTANLVHFDRLEPAGATFAASRFERQSEFVATPDNWSRPVNLASGPDGALYVCDMYRKTIEHPDYLPPEIRKRTDFESGKTMGRIYRVVRSDIDAAGLRDRRAAACASRSTAELCAALSSPGGWTRERARRLLLEGHDLQTVAALRELATAPLESVAAAAALRLLEATGAIDSDTLLTALANCNPGVREVALQIAEPRLTADSRLLERALALADDPNARVRFQCALSLGESQDERVIAPLAKIAAQDAADRWLRAAALSAIAGREKAFLERLTGELSGATSSQVALLGEVGQLIGAGVEKGATAADIDGIVAPVRSRDFETQAALIAGFADALRVRQPGGLRAALSQDAVPDDQRRFFRNLFADALRIAQDPNQTVERRTAALSLLGDADPPAVGEPLLGLITPQQPAAVQSGAIRAIRFLGDVSLAGKLLTAERFRSFTPAVREEVLAAMFAQPAFLSQLLSAVESRAVPIGVIDSLRRGQLGKHKNVEIRERAAKLFAASAVGDRSKVFEDYKSVLSLTPAAANGRRVFVKSCANCHRLDREGTPVGPDLLGIRNQPKEAILLHVLIPEYEITPGFAAYVLETTDGRIVTGLLAADTSDHVTLRQALGKEETVLRKDIEMLTLSKLSLMPQELEKLLTRQELADLLAYLKGE